MEDMSAFLSGSPGSHPHSDRPNWRLGDEDIDELLIQKIADATRRQKRAAACQTVRAVANAVMARAHDGADTRAAIRAAVCSRLSLEDLGSDWSRITGRRAVAR